MIDDGDINQPKPKRKGEEREREKKENTSKRKEENIEGQEKRRIKKVTVTSYHSVPIFTLMYLGMTYL